MKLKKFVLPILMCMAILSSCKNNEQAQVAHIEKEEKIDTTEETQAVKEVMKAYKDALQNLTTEGAYELFTNDALVFEQGKVEGTYTEYIDHHLGPELNHFKSFTFSDYEIAVNVNLPYAYTTESYLYTIVLKGDEAKGTEERTIESKGVATSILKNIEGEWKIVHSHTSFKKL